LLLVLLLLLLLLLLSLLPTRVLELQVPQHKRCQVPRTHGLCICSRSSTRGSRKWNSTVLSDSTDAISSSSL
jgi:hypothetical protein